MFGLLAQKKEGEIDAELERLRSQHAALHDYMNEISQALDAYSKNIDSEVRRLHRALSEYIETLRRHIHAENRIFYPLVAKTLSKDEMQWLMGEFDKYAAKEGPDATKQYGDIIEEMGRLV
jgi:hemerythrin-like domain-containing protein